LRSSRPSTAPQVRPKSAWLPTRLSAPASMRLGGGAGPLLRLLGLRLLGVELELGPELGEGAGPLDVASDATTSSVCGAGREGEGGGA
jgi:hypothetical protein